MKKIAELLILFVLIPVLYWLDWVPVHKIIPLLALFGYCLFIVVKEGALTKEQFHLKAPWLLILTRFVLIGGVILLSIHFYFEAPLLTDVGANKKLMWMLVMYPLFSAFPQELIFRHFFFYRYRDLFAHPRMMVVANVILFAFAHVYFANGIVLAFTVVGGMLFSWTYLQTRSLLVVTIEHTLYGLLILSSGLSDHFYKAF